MPDHRVQIVTPGRGPRRVSIAAEVVVIGEESVTFKPGGGACKAPARKASRKVSFACDVEVIGGRTSSVSFVEEVEVIGVSDGSHEDDDEDLIALDADVWTPLSDDDPEIDPADEDLFAAALGADIADDTADAADEDLFAEAHDAVAPLPVIPPPRSSSLHWRGHRRSRHAVAIPQSPPPPYIHCAAEEELEEAERSVVHAPAPAYDDDESPPTYATAWVAGQAEDEEGGEDIVLEEVFGRIGRWFYNALGQ